LNKDAFDKVKTIAKIPPQLLTGVMAVNFFLAAILSTSLTALWSTINILQLVVYIPLFRLNFPAAIQVLQGLLVKLVTFEMLDSEDLTNALYGESSFSPEFHSPIKPGFKTVEIDNMIFSSN
jgi:hypothetical protein